MSASRFIAALLTIERPGARAAGHFSAPAEYAAEASLSGEPAAAVARSWDTPPKGADAALAAFARVAESAVESPSPAYTLRLTEPGQAVKTITWNEAAESPDLAEVRTFFEGSGHLAFLLASAYRKRAALLGEQGRDEDSIAALRAGIDVLGKRYQSPRIIDDTGMKLVLAKQNEKQGKRDVARSLYEAVLDSRLAAYEAGIGG